jgi:hypothetical protein
MNYFLFLFNSGTGRGNTQFCCICSTASKRTSARDVWTASLAVTLHTLKQYFRPIYSAPPFTSAKYEFQLLRHFVIKFFLFYFPEIPVRSFKWNFVGTVFSASHSLKSTCSEFDVLKSVHHHTIKINQPTRCNSFTSLLLDHKIKQQTLKSQNTTTLY